MKINRKATLSALVLLGLSATPLAPAFAQDDAMTEGTIRKVDTEQGKVTIKHGPITNLEMPPMTMVFGVRDAALLDGFEKGDEVRFHVVDDGGKMVIESLESAE